MAKDQHRDDMLNENPKQTDSPEKDPLKRSATKQKSKGRKESSSMATRENTGSEEYEASQQKDDNNIGPLDAELGDLPSESRVSKNNQTGPGLG